MRNDLCQDAETDWTWSRTVSQTKNFFYRAKGTLSYRVGPGQGDAFLSSVSLMKPHTNDITSSKRPILFQTIGSVKKQMQVKVHSTAEATILSRSQKKNKPEIQTLARSLRNDWKLGIGAPPSGKRATAG